MARHRVQVLREAGMKLRRIASETGISYRSVHRIVHEPKVGRPAVEGQACERGVGRPSVVEKWRERVAAVLRG